ncbi:MAG: RNA-binding S4 domain-containing protein [Firmicutes bacterium]|nr:RNA-binding S4 domain-containing protein [Bacillota bacterium]
MSDVYIKDEFIKLQQAMKLARVVSSGSEAKIYITEGEVKVNGEVCLQRGKKLRNGDTVEFKNNSFTVKNSDQ